ncbi:MAG: M24 family metallopeptidase [Myxococcales bacterium]|nr:M24 family metallopeptidase [Myxococcales bacterium]
MIRMPGVAMFAVLALAAPAAAQPVEAPVDPYAEPTKPPPAKRPGKPTKPAKPAKPAAAPTAPTPVDPYADAAPPAPVEAAPVDPYAAPPAAKPARPTKPTKPAKPSKPAPPPVTGPLDPYAAPATTAPVDPYAAPATTAPVDPYAAPATKPVDPYAAPPTAPVAPVAPPVTTVAGRIDVAAVQGLLAVQNLDGWLLADHGGMNPVARSLVDATGAPTRRWFYLVPRQGEPTLVVHASEVASFAAVPGKRVIYTGYRDLDPILKKLLKGKKTLAMEYSPRGALPSLSRVDAGTIELVRAAGVTVKPSDALVQFSKASWGLDGRKAHYLAAHHLAELRKDALAFLRERLAANQPVTEREVADRIAKGMATRGLVGPPPVVAFGAHTADPTYTPPVAGSATLARGDLVLLGLAGKVDGGIYAAATWVAVADAIVTPRLAELFAATTGARDAVIGIIRDRVKRRRAIAGWEVDKAAGESLLIAGVGDLILHRTGHSLDVDLFGSGTDLDDLEIHDSRSLVVGTGFTIGPGVYSPGELGLRTEVSAYLGKDGLEITTPAQTTLELLVAQ